MPCTSQCAGSATCTGGASGCASSGTVVPAARQVAETIRVPASGQAT
ncbi:hypothetical protein ACFS32_23450 [Novosphingobium pokkalii]